VFSERLETLRWLHGQFSAICACTTADHAYAASSRYRAAGDRRRFGRREDPLRLLLCSDVASEGLNFHYFCHRLIHSTCRGR
jgi:hypothetical protein